MLWQGGCHTDHSDTRLGANSTEWNYLKKELAGDFQLIVWDLPGPGGSTRPTIRDYSMENLSRDLAAVLELAGERAFLLGHSIGGMERWPKAADCRDGRCFQLQFSEPRS
jgi:surfactin synthase thioesterase subunit